MQAVPDDVGIRCRYDSALLLEANRILRRIGVLPRFDFDEDKDGAFPSDDVNLAALRAIAGCHDTESERAQVIDAEDFGPAAESQQTM